MVARPKYRNKKTNGFDSAREQTYAYHLEALKHASDPCERVVTIEYQVKFNLIPSQRVRGVVVERPCDYIADFRVTYFDGRVEVIDVKGFKTKDYIIKRKLMRHVHGIAIREV